MRHKIALMAVCLLFSLVVVTGENFYENEYISVELLSNTYNCLTNCEAEIRVCSKGGIKYLNENNFDLWFTDSNLKTKSGFEYQMIKKNTEVKQVDVYEFDTKEVCNKTTDVCQDQQYVSGIHQEPRTEITYENFDPTKSPSLFPVDGCIDLKIKGEKEANENVDWKINLMGLEPDWAWWNNSFNFKRRINITSPQANYSIPMNLTFNTHYNATDCSDIRFTNSSENEELDYWVESNASSSWCYVWVETRQADDIYLYYGNSSNIVSTSDIEDSFIYGVDWRYQSSMPSEWLNTSTVGYTFSGTDGIVLTFSGGDSWTRGMYLHDVNLTEAVAIRTVDYTQSSGLGFACGLTSNPTSSNRIGAEGNDYEDKAVSGFWALATVSGGSPDAGTTGGTASSNTLYTVEAIYNNSNRQRMWVKNQGYIINTTASNQSPVRMSYGAYFSSTTLKIKQTAIRHYFEPEPSITISGDEGIPVIDSTPPTWQDILENTADPATYSPTPNYGFQVNCTDETAMGTPVLETNVTGSWANISTTQSGSSEIYYANVTSMAVGVLNYSFVCIDSSGNNNRTDYNTFTVNQASSTVDLLLNGTDADVSYDTGDPANFTGIVTEAGLNISMATNITGWVDQTNKISPYENTSTVLNCSDTVYFNISVWSVANENYSSSIEEHFAICSVPPVPGNYTEQYCSADGNYLITNVTDLAGVSVYTYLRCEYNCTETLTGTRCDYTPSVKAGLWVGIIIGLFVVLWLLFTILKVLVR